MTAALAPPSSAAEDGRLANRLRAHIADVDRQALAHGPLGLARYLDPKVKARPHLRAISDTMSLLQPGSGARVMVVTPPQVGKSQTAIWCVLWWLAQHPEHRNVIIGACSSRLAGNRGRSVRKLVDDHGHRYGLVKERGSASVMDYRLVGGGGVRSAGTRSGIAGDPADFALVDDPFAGRADAQSRVTRDRVGDWWSADLNARLAPEAPVLIVNTRWHPDDLSGRLLETEGLVEDGGAWHLVHLPALALAPSTEQGIGPDGLGRAPGEPLSHPKIAPGDKARALRHWENKRRASTPRDWASLYQGLPREETDVLLSRKALREARVTSAPPAVRSAVAVDPSGEGRSTAGIIAGHTGEDGVLYVTHDRTGVMSIDLWAETVCLLSVEIDADVIIVERNFGNRMASNILRSAWRELRREGRIPPGTAMPYIDEVWARKNKRLRAEPMAQQVVLGNIKLVGIHPELEEEIATWVLGSPDSPGRIDALTHLAFGTVIGQVDDGDSELGHPADYRRDDPDIAGASGIT